LKPQDALQQLVDGNARFVAGKAQFPGADPQRRVQVAQAQKPFATILGCSDSRVPPELLFDQGLGDLFVIRVAGNVYDEQALGSIEYSVEVVGVPLIVVLGHERCGAVKETVEIVEHGGTAPGHIRSLIEAIEPAVKSVHDQPGDEVDNAVRANVRLVAQNLTNSEPILAPKAASGAIHVIGARYDLDEGKVEWLK
jgi:carbonic anhydrase